MALNLFLFLLSFVFSLVRFNLKRKPLIPNSGSFFFQKIQINCILYKKGNHRLYVMIENYQKKGVPGGLQPGVSRYLRYHVSLFVC